MSYWYDTIHTTEQINASPEKVYSILTDFDSYSSWNPFLISVSLNNQPFTPGTSLSTTINTNQKNDGSAASPMSFSPKLTWVKENEGFEWLGQLPIGGLFDGAHKFEIKKTEDGRGCVIEQKEDFSGFVIWLGRKTGALWYSNMMENTKLGFSRMNQSLKEKAEQ